MTLPRSNRLSQVEEYYFSVKLKEVRQLQAEGKNILNLGIGNPDLPPPSGAKHTLIEALELDGIHAYQSYRGIPELRNSFASWYENNYGITLDPEQEILPLMGSKEGIMHITMAFTNPGESVIIPDPGYPAYESVSRLLGLEIKKYDLTEGNGWQLDPDQLAGMIDEDSRILWLNYPHMPTGTKADPGLFRELIALAKDRKLLLINDNPYSLINNDEPLSLLNFSGIDEHVIELNSLSKSHHMPGWRVGCAVGSSSNVNSILRVKSNFDSGMFKAVQLAAAKAMTTENAWHQQQNEIYRKRKEKTQYLCDLLSCTYQEDTAGLFVWAKKPEAFESGEAFADYLLYERNLFVAPGFIFGKNGKDFVRISLCQPEEYLDQIIEKIKEI
jgi:LL-diaminopimelate aminotransferase